MPNFLKALFGPSTMRVHRKAKTQCQAQARERSHEVLKPCISHRGGKGRGTPEADISGEWQDPAQFQGGLLDDVIELCSQIIDTATEIQSSSSNTQRHPYLLSRIITLLESQREELRSVNRFTGQKKFPALVTLKQIYRKVQSALHDIIQMMDNDAEERLTSLIKSLEEGPDYLIDVILITSIIHQASIISIPLSNEIRIILDKAINSRSTLVGFREGSERILSITLALDEDSREDIESQQAFYAIRELIKQLQTRIFPTKPTMSGSRNSSSSSTPTPLHLPPSPAAASISSSASSIAASPEPDFTSMSSKQLLEQFGTGAGTGTKTTPLPGLSSYQSTTYPSYSIPLVPAHSGTRAGSVSSANSDSESDPEIWEYRGNRLTASALQLVLSQEMQMAADSSGQYAGEVSWDDLRKIWIPKHVAKLKVSDLTNQVDNPDQDPEGLEGELPDTTPAGFKLKEEDEWGNKIGWYDNGSGVKEMYYLEEPVFELRDDDD
ncbi:uncharacterized protein I303_105719 [Kwoniella dejecticola CBS 10117]|uniref:Uncharacterized protein n=1 Tax=Kwoniella dejecticola CBS 10117 TaxID=1296121 RepID=A0A1A6A087_9TREE|nr:uncharacterized protein I303_05740 [Kwoniella dejecticola CBS 10117]OBR83461.1 hypothetical protein I303_05740 [Kwoniella dejecticola CBS 10117]